MTKTPPSTIEQRSVRKGVGENKPASARGSRPSSGRVTLQAVANLAGVSMMTVSRVINRPEMVTPEIAETVRKVIADTGYVPNLLAGGLASSRSRLVAAVVPTLSHHLFAGAVQSLTDRMAEGGYQVLLGLSGYPSREDDMIHAILGRRPDALYLTGTGHSAQTRRHLQSANIPIVETWDLGHKPVDMAVGFSHAAVGKAVAEFLLDKGHRRFAVLGADDERATARHRKFTAVLKARGAEAVIPVQITPPSSLSTGREAMGRLLDEGFARGAIFCSSDAMAHGVILEAQARGLAVPGDIAVVGFGDIDFAAYTTPPLTTVSVNRETIGQRAAEVLLTRLGGGEVGRKIIDVGFSIIERATA